MDIRDSSSTLWGRDDLNTKYTKYATLSQLQPSRGQNIHEVLMVQIFTSKIPFNEFLIIYTTIHIIYCKLS